MGAIDRFRLKYEVASTGCWLWTARTNDDGYGTFWTGRRRPSVGGRRGTPISVLAHRWSFEHFIGPISDGLCVLHRCDTPACVNPAHLFLGTQADNVADCEAKGRRNQARFQKLSPAIHAEIRRRYVCEPISQSALARDYGVSQPTIRHIVNRTPA